MKFLNTILLLASVAMNSVHGEVKYFSKCINDRDFAITFDDGPSLDYTSKVLDVLDEFHVKATFFVNGKNCVDITENKTARDLIKREYESGHIIGSHTFTHPYGITTLTDEELTEELDDLNNALFDIIGVKPNFFRPPLGEYNEENLKIIEKSGIKANILWNLDSEDWNPSYNATEQYYKGLEGKDPFTHSFIALNHDIQKVTAETNLRIVIPYIKSLGYNIVPMDVCTGIPAYQGQDSISNEKENTDSNNNDTNANNNTDNNTNNTDNSNNTDDNNMVVDENQQSLNNNGNTSDATTIKSSILFSTIMISFIITFLI
eukprot:jgi/Orpsp1_1/1177473/evm.model.c7180000061569.1